jgi:TatD DNase family protein
VHPCSATAFDTHPSGPTGLLSSLATLASNGAAAGTVVAVGEIGLDYDRLHYTPADQQLRHFEAQLDEFAKLTPSLPLFLHMRAASDDFERILAPRLQYFPKKGLVHSFTGTVTEMQRLVDLGLDIGVNGCSLKTEENLEVVKMIPLERLQIETDGPWCEIRPSHASHKMLVDAPSMPKAVKKEKFAKGMMVKGRNEPCTIPLVAHVIAKLKGITVEEVCEA